MGASASTAGDADGDPISKARQHFRSLARKVGFLGSRRPISAASRISPDGDDVIIYRFSKDDKVKQEQNIAKLDENDDIDDNKSINGNNASNGNKKGIGQKFFDARAKRLARAEKRAPEEKCRGGGGGGRGGGVVVVDHASSFQNDGDSLGRKKSKPTTLCLEMAPISCGSLAACCLYNCSCYQLQEFNDF